MNVMTMPIFELSVFLLPQGRARLNIFEPRYLHMVSVAAKANGFAIVLNEFIGQPKMIGSWVDIIDFNTSEQGVLVIDVKCKALVSFTSIYTYKDERNLLWASYTPLDHWPALAHNPLTKIFSQLLDTLFHQYESLSGIYHQEFIDTPNWVMSRWLELLPLETKDKMLFFEQHSDEKAQIFLGDLLLESKLESKPKKIMDLM